MAKLYFNYSSMNAGKSTMLLQANHNYLERGMNPVIYTSNLDSRFGKGEIVSRIGLKSKSNTFDIKTDIYNDILSFKENILIDCVLIDEAQFLTKNQVDQLGKIVDELDIPVLAFGIRTDFQGNLFEGSKYLLAWADNLKEIKTVCHCGRKATMVLRVDDEGSIVSDGSQIEIGGEERYVSVCRKHFKEKKIS
ncbi:MAG: thymidine kinase [Gammaproteobacteria bacterium]|nr:MAG: thymidine kinase [Gammaproteobacteria bacterium]|tara:strand:- start:99 stop:677 length:579 start_codon:yes stop_codon:yes gene_type:complete